MNLLKTNKAPLIITDINDLGDKRLSPEEGVEKLREGNRALAQKNKLPEQDKVSNAREALGRPMAATDLIRRIRKLNPLILVMQGGMGEGHVAIRYPHQGDAMAYCTGFPLVAMPEYSATVQDENGVAKKEIRGWREVLKKLIEFGALRLEDCNVEFGVALGSRAERWEHKVNQSKEKKNP